MVQRGTLAGRVRETKRKSTGQIGHVEHVHFVQTAFRLSWIGHSMTATRTVEILEIHESRSTGFRDVPAVPLSIWSRDMRLH
jgi:hypothetical protein